MIFETTYLCFIYLIFNEYIKNKTENYLKTFLNEVKI